MKNNNELIELLHLDVRSGKRKPVKIQETVVKEEKEKLDDDENKGDGQEN